MDKLIELLETFEKENVEKLKSDVWGNDNISPRVWSESDITIYNKLQVISKEYGFIKWLIDNDKIEPLRKFIGWETDEDEPYIQFDLVDQYIAYLSIQDNPIEFLVSILR